MASVRAIIQQRLKTTGLFVLFFIGLFSLTGCNSTWFYRPNDKTYKNLSAISPYTPYFIPSNSGNQLHTLLIPAEQNTDYNNTLLVHFHGNAANLTWTAQRYSWMTAYGYDLLVFDYSGYGLSTGEPTPKTTFQDSFSILDHTLALQKQHQWKNIILMGTSLGGNVLLQALSHYPDIKQFTLVFIDSSFLSYRDVAASMIRKGYGGFAFDWIGRLLISDQFAPINRLNQLPDISFVVAHCKDDQLINFDLGYHLYQQLPVTNKVLLPLANCQHANGFNSEQPEHRNRLLTLFNQYPN